MGGKSSSDLLVLQKSMRLVDEIYRLTNRFPMSEECCLISKVRRAAVSIPSNIAEGQARNHAREFRQFLSIALGSLAEPETQLEISIRIEILSPAEFEEIRLTSQEIGRMLHDLSSSIKHI